MEPDVTFGDFRRVAADHGCKEEPTQVHLNGDLGDLIRLVRDYGDSILITAIPADRDDEIMTWELLYSDARVLAIPISAFGDRASRYALAEQMVRR